MTEQTAGERERVRQAMAAEEARLGATRTETVFDYAICAMIVMACAMIVVAIVLPNIA